MYELQFIFLFICYWSCCGFFDFNWVLWGFFLFEYQGKCYFFGGDSVYQWLFVDIGICFLGIDLVMLVIGVYVFDFMMQGVYMNFDEVFMVWQELGVQRMVLMYYGIYDLSNEFISEFICWMKKNVVVEGRRDDLIVLVVNQVVYL